MTTADIERLLAPVEKVLLDGEKFPRGKQFDRKETQHNIEISVPRIVSAYDLLNSSEKDKRLLSKIFYLARDLDSSFYFFAESELSSFVGEEGIQRIRRIIGEGRRLSLSEPRSVEERIEQAKLYRIDELSRLSSGGRDFVAAQLRDPKRGCSASICTNCDEPIAYAHYTCNVCEYDLINANDMPRIEPWEELDTLTRVKKLKEGWNSMMRDIKPRGDWRGLESPFNRYVHS